MSHIFLHWDTDAWSGFYTYIIVIRETESKDMNSGDKRVIPFLGTERGF